MDEDGIEKHEVQKIIQGQERSKADLERGRRAILKLYLHAAEIGREMEEHPERFGRKCLEGKVE